MHPPDLTDKFQLPDKSSNRRKVAKFGGVAAFSAHTLTAFLLRLCLVAVKNAFPPTSAPPTMSYKSSNFRKSQPANDSSDKFRAQAKQLQEAFPTWSYDGTSPALPSTFIFHISPRILRSPVATERDQRGC